MELNSLMKHLSGIDKFSFHMPGHKGRFPALFGSFDPTELPGLDNLHYPKGVLARAQVRIADIYKSKKTYFLVNGSSVGLMAAITAITRPGTLVLVQRTCHKAVLSGLIHSGAMPVWIEQDYCRDLSLWLPPTRERMQELIAAYPVRAAILANPDYFGFAPDIVGITELCHTAKIPVIVDEAHGAHLSFGRDLGLPKSGIDAHADIIIQSPHKTLAALTQAAWMHLTNLDMGEMIQQSLNLFQTTSPSYLLMASLEHAGIHAGQHASQLLKQLAMLMKILEKKADSLGLSPWPRLRYRDWTKFVLPNRAGMEALLRDRGIYPELVQGDKILLMATIADAVDSSGIAALHRVMPEAACLPGIVQEDIQPPPLPVQACTPREAWLHKGEKVTLGKALGRISRQVIAPYPPGTIVIAPGHRLDRESIEYLHTLQAGKVIPEWIEVI